jgi:subtilisin family serine protease
MTSSSSALPAWSHQFLPENLPPWTPQLTGPITRDWAWGGATGAGVKVAVIDSGVDGSHPDIGGALRGGVSVEVDPEAPGGVRLEEGPHDDRYGHGTACAAIIRRAAPDAELYSVRVLGPTLKGTGSAFAAGLRWALDHGMQVCNLSLSTRSRDHFATLHELADHAYFQRSMLVCAINNVDAPSYPSQYASVFSCAARAGHDPFSFAYNPRPPVEFGAPGLDVEVAWLNGGRMRATGNSFAAPHIAGLVARTLSKHPGLTPFQMKAVLAALADNASGGVGRVSAP